MKRLGKINGGIFIVWYLVLCHSVFAVGPTEEASSAVLKNVWCGETVLVPDSTVLGTGVSKISACQAATNGMQAVQANAPNCKGQF